jgi:2-isopropylmalate synthase
MSASALGFRPCIIDSTLREGMQAPGVRFGVQESVEVAAALLALGVDMVECGHPFVSEAEAERVRAVVVACGDVPVLAHARARKEDIQSVYEAGPRWVGIFAGVNDVSRRCRIRGGVPMPALIGDAISFAKSLGLSVRFTIEDGSRTPGHELIEAFKVALDAGADRICLADTLGLMSPWQVQETVTLVLQALGGPALEVHFHDDRGMAAANALAAARAGVRWISSSINGIGERCGITDTITLLANLYHDFGRPLPPGEALQHASLLVQAHARMPVDRWRPVVGRNAFTHVAKLHRRATAADERAYAWLPPTLLGRTQSIEPASLPAERSQWINRPAVISATELRHHRHGPGERYLMLDERVVGDARQYCIVRRIPLLADYGEGHVDAHRHTVDSLFMFIGDGPAMTGLQVEVTLADECFAVDSPCSVFIPAGVVHSYRVRGGSGSFVNHVLAGTYNASLLDRCSTGAAGRPRSMASASA